MEPVRFGVVGVGGMGAAHVRAILQMAEGELVAGADVAPEARERFTSEHARPCHERYQDLVARDDIEAVAVVTPHPLHREIAVAALEAGKHVLVEKPMSSNVRDADAMIACAEARGRTLGVVFQQRFNPVMREARRRLESGDLGDLLRLSMTATLLRTQAYYRRGTGWRGTWAGEHGGLLLNQAPHPLDVFCWLAGMPVRLWGFTSTRLHEMETEDMASAVMEFPDGSHGTFHASTCEGPDGFEFVIACTRGKLAYRRGQGLRVVRSSVPAIDYIMESANNMDGMEYREEPIAAEDRPSHAETIRDFACAVREGRPPAVPGREGRKSLELANAIVLSSEREKCVTLPVDRDEYAALLEEKIALHTA